MAIPIQNSETTDPFTGEKRRTIRKPRHRYTIKIRHDVTAWKLNYSAGPEWYAERIATGTIILGMRGQF